MKKLNLFRHPKDYWCDRLIVESISNVVRLRIEIKIQERYKTSGLSGDEWRFNYPHQIINDNDVLFEDTVNSFEYAIKNILQSLSHFSENLNELFKVTFSNRNIVLYQTQFDSLLETLLKLPALETRLREGSEHDYFDKLDGVRKSSCSQPGCMNPPVSILELKALYDRDGNKTKTWLGEKGNTGYYRHFCVEHLIRGDCDLEDADDNYILVSGPSLKDSVIPKDKKSESQIIFM